MSQWPQLLCLYLLTIPYCSCSDSEFDFGLFENFQVCETIFKDELQVVNKIKGLNAIFNSKLELLKQLKASQPFDRTEFQSAPKKLHALKNEMASLSTEFGLHHDWQAAQKGFIALIDTYDLSIPALFNGTLMTSNSLTSGIALKGVRSQSKFGVGDLVNMAHTARNMMWIDVSIKLARTAQDILNDEGIDLHFPNERFKEMISNELMEVIKYLPQTNNNYLTKKKYTSGTMFKVLPYTIDENLKKKKKQPKFLKTKEINQRDFFDPEAHETTYKENRFRRVCRGEVVGGNVTAQLQAQLCHFIHHDDPYLRLGPFKIEVLLKDPMRTIFHDFFSETEINWLIDTFTPNLSRTRGDSPNNMIPQSKARKAEGYTRTIHKTVQAWMDSRIYAEQMEFSRLDMQPKDLKDPDTHIIENQALEDLGYKIELASQLVVRKRLSATKYQVTNYGLGGLCETHVDPHGYLSNKKVEWHQKDLFATGDMIATFMGWLADVEGGGATAYDQPGYEQLVTPTRGSAAFWYDLKASNYLENRSSHGGCPVLLGSKWILNKWIMSFDQMFKLPCRLNKKDPLSAEKFLKHRY